MVNLWLFTLIISFFNLILTILLFILNIPFSFTHFLLLIPSLLINIPLHDFIISIFDFFTIFLLFTFFIIISSIHRTIHSSHLALDNNFFYFTKFLLSISFQFLFTPSTHSRTLSFRFRLLKQLIFNSIISSLHIHLI